MIVVIEGIDACGKETQVRKLKQWALANADEMWLDDIHEQDFPDYTNVTGRRIGELLRGEWSVVTNEPGEKELTKALVMQCLMVTNRLEHGRMLNKYVNEPSSLLILDRYHASGQIYGRADGLSPVWLEDIHVLVPDPDLWVLVDISVEESFRRRPERQDYYEKNRAQLEEVRELYLGLFAEQRESGHDHWFVVDGTGKIDDIHSRIVSPVRDWLMAR